MRTGADQAYNEAYKDECNRLDRLATIRRVADMQAEIERLRAALSKSVELQSHYARLLNSYDSGHRMQFADADAWMQRLETVGQKVTDA